MEKSSIFASIQGVYRLSFREAGYLDVANNKWR